ncbi:MAG: hypothetical protein ACREB0_00175 [Sphingopyxis sp.]
MSAELFLFTRKISRAEALARWPLPSHIVHARALSQGYESGHDPYNSADVARAIDFEIERSEFHADDAVASVIELADADVRRGWGRPAETGPQAAAQARYSAIAVEADRESVALDLLREALDLAALGDVDETTEAYGWGEWVKRARAVTT